MVIGTQRYFDYANPDYVRKLVDMYFEKGYPFEPHLSGAFTEIADMRTLRNASVHVTSTTQTALEALAFRLFLGGGLSHAWISILFSQGMIPARPQTRRCSVSTRTRWSWLPN